VDLVVADLDKELDNSNYLKSHPDISQMLRDALLNLSGTAFSLQQLLFDLDNVVLETVPAFHGVEEGSDAEYILQKYFVDLYSATAKERGLPLVSINEVSEPQEESTLHMTAMERIVSPLKDSSGKRITSPSPYQEAATTLNYLCAINNKPVPRISSFGWNWVGLEEINEISGVIAINRNILVQNLVDALRPAALECCYRPSVSRNDGLQVSTDGALQVETYLEGSKVIHLEHCVTDEGLMAFEESSEETYHSISISARALL
jgi:hypothetical protein